MRIAVIRPLLIAAALTLIGERGISAVAGDSGVRPTRRTAAFPRSAALLC